jgi:hypothetical protein
MMTEVLTAALTVVLGFVVLVLGQIAQRFFIEPIQEQKRIIGEIAYSVRYFRNVGHRSTDAEREEAHRTLRKLSGQLYATLWTIPYYGLFEPRGWVEKRENVVTASAELVGWEIATVMKDDPAASRHRSALIKALGLPT